MKRTDLVEEVRREIGSRSKSKTKHYLTKKEMMELLLYLQRIKKGEVNREEVSVLNT